MDPKYEDLELEAVRKNYGGIKPVWQEMAKNPALPGSGTMPAHPEGVHPNLIKHKEQKTLARVGAKRTQVSAAEARRKSIER